MKSMSYTGYNKMVVGQTVRHASARVLPYHLRHSTAVRHLARAQKANDEDRSWEDIGKDAVGVAKSLFNKIKKGASDVVETISSKPVEKPRSDARIQQREESSNFPLAGGMSGLLGRAVGGLMAGAVQTISKQLEESAKDRDVVFQIAADRINSDPTIRSRLGAVQCGQPMSQSVSSSSINGRTTRTVSLVIPVYTTTGRTAQAQVQHNDSDGSAATSVVVRMPEGDVIRLDDSPSGGAGTGRVVDVDYWEVR